MILFEKDWANWPTAQIHYNSKQDTWKRLAAVYKRMGIKNHAFLLAIIDPRLADIDPHSPNITEEQLGWVAVEAKCNPWYFFRECVRVPAQSGAEARPLLANRGNISLFWCFFNHIIFILIQPRQTGKSISTDALMIYLMHVACKDTVVNLLTKDEKLRRENIARLKEMREELPWYFRLRSSDDANNTEVITVNMLGNKYLSHVAQPSIRGANNMARGFTSPIFHIDEPPFQVNIDIALGPALAAGSAARSIAAEAGSPYGTIFTTTAGKKDEKEGAFFYYKIYQRAAEWDERFFDAVDQADLHDIIRKAMVNEEGKRGVIKSAAPMVNATFNHKQLGYTDEWLAMKLSEAMQDGQSADRDFFNVWTSGTQSSPFTPQQLDQIDAGTKENPDYLQITPQRYTLRWYVPEELIEDTMRDMHVINFDPSEASGRDDIGVTMVNSRTLKTTMAATINETNIIVFSRWVGEFMMKYKRTVAVIERRSMGAALVDFLIEFFHSRGEDPFRRIFNRVVNDYDDRPERFKEINVPLRSRDVSLYVKYKNTFGWATSGGGLTSRKELYGTTMQMVLKRAADRIYDKVIAKQLKSLVIKKDRVDHPDGEHDDMVISWLLGHWLLIHGRNLSWYGFDINVIGIDGFREKKIVRTAEEEYQMAEQRYLRDRFAQVFEQLKRERDPYLQNRLEMEARMLESKIIEEESEIFSVDELLESLRTERKDRIREKSQARSARQRFADQYGQMTGSDVFSRSYVDDGGGWGDYSGRWAA